jgi:hypothetical protein
MGNGTKPGLQSTSVARRRFQCCRHRRSFNPPRIDESPVPAFEETQIPQQILEAIAGRHMCHEHLANRIRPSQRLLQGRPGSVRRLPRFPLGRWLRGDLKGARGRSAVGSSGGEGLLPTGSRSGLATRTVPALSATATNVGRRKQLDCLHLGVKAAQNQLLPPN